MAGLRPSGPYIWATWLTKLMAEEASCEWANWFNTQHEGSSWSRVPSDFDQTQWVINHPAQHNRCREERERRGYDGFTDGQNAFNLRDDSATLAGKPDITATRAGQRHHHRREDRQAPPFPRHPGHALHVRHRQGTTPAQGDSVRRPGPASGYPGLVGERRVHSDHGPAHTLAGRIGTGEKDPQPVGMRLLRHHVRRLPQKGWKLLRS